MFTYIPNTCVSAVLQKLAEQITETEQRYPDSLVIILGDFNNLKSLPWTAKIPTAHYMSHNKVCISLSPTCRFGALWSLSSSS